MIKAMATLSSVTPGCTPLEMHLQGPCMHARTHSPTRVCARACAQVRGYEADELGRTHSAVRGTLEVTGALRTPSCRSTLLIGSFCADMPVLQPMAVLPVPVNALHASARAQVTVPLGDTTAGSAPPMALSLFGDAGGGTVRSADTPEMRLSGGAAAGVGLRYGPFRIDYAYNVGGNRKVHVGLVQD